MGQNRFVRLGDIRGRTVAEIVKAVGKPTSVSSTATGQLYQWIKTGLFGSYHYAIAFDQEGRAIGYTHQFTK